MSITPIFTVVQLKHNPGLVIADLSVNRDSEIFNGHFPGQPIVPGACMLQVVKDILESALHQTLRLKTAGHLKFISMIDPREIDSLQLVIAYTTDNGQINATAQLHRGDTTCFKFQGAFIIVTA